MELFFKTIAGILLSVILILALEKQTTALLLAAAVCVMVAGVAVSYLSDVKNLLMELKSIADLQDGLLGILLKCTAVAIVTELTGCFCQDAGAASLKKAVQFLGNSVILYLSIPAFQALVTLLKDVLSEL